MFHKGRKVKKSKKKKIISLIVVVAVAGTSGAVVYRKVRRPVAAATEVSKVQTAEVKKGNISNTITGTGNLELDDAEAVSIPSGLTIGDVLVESGDYVSVTLSDGTVVTGTVDTQESGSTIITVTDNGTTLGDEVSVSDSNGNVLGSGTLYIHQPFEVTAAGGTVSSVSVTENASVSADDELLVLEGTESSAEYEKLLLVRKARTETLQKLA